MSHEAELPGTKISKTQWQIILARYYFAGKFISEKNVLEVGCGPGLGLDYLAERSKKLVTIDYSDENIKIARNLYKRKTYNKKIEIIKADAHNLSIFKTNNFDVIVVMATAYALDLNKFFSECFNILKKGDLLIFDIPNKDTPSFRGSELGRSYYSVPELFKILEKNHFKAKIFGAFPIKEGIKMEQREKFRVSIIRTVSKIIRLIPERIGIKKFLDRFILHKIILKKEIKNEDMEIIKDIKFTPLAGDIPNFSYRILYFTAYKK